MNIIHVLIVLFPAIVIALIVLAIMANRQSRWIVGLLVLLPSLASAQALTIAPVTDHWWVDVPLITATVAAEADGFVTMYARGRLKENFYEKNGFLRLFANDPVVFAVVKGGADTLTIWFLIKHHKAHPKLVATLAVAKTVISAVITHHNAKVVGLRGKP